MEETDEERRREPRYRLNKMLGLVLEGEDFAAELRIFVLDISAAGLRVTCPQELPAQQYLKFTLRLPDKGPKIKGSFAVRWQRLLAASGNHEIGVEFLELSEENWRALREYVGTLLSQPAKTQENLCTPWQLKM
jgi:c-di-GMP-binding flagellar brake protein YcgR